jgi:hypothetical protein
MKILATAALVAMTMGSTTAFADDHESHYKDLYDLKELHAAFHKAVSHAGIDATTKAQALADILALWAASCDAGAQTLCDFYNNHAGGLVLGHDWVSLTPIFTESIHLLDHKTAELYFQCIYFDVNNNDVLKSNATFGLPDMPHTAIARKVHGHWLFAFGEFTSIPPPTLDVYQE